MNKLDNISQAYNTASDEENAVSYREVSLNTLLDDESKFIFFRDKSLADRIWESRIPLRTSRTKKKTIFKKEQLEELIIKSKLNNKSDEKLSVVGFNATIDIISKLLDTTYCYYDEDLYEQEEYAQVKIDALYTKSTKELLRRLALYTGQMLSTLFRVLRNTRIHSLSIFFGLCCSCSGYIFEAITGTSSHPVPANN